MQRPPALTHFVSAFFDAPRSRRRQLTIDTMGCHAWPAASPPTASADGSPVWLVRPVFESDATVAALVADFFKSHGTYYAQNVLRPILRQLTKEPKAYEVRARSGLRVPLRACAFRACEFRRGLRRCGLVRSAPSVRFPGLRVPLRTCVFRACALRCGLVRSELVRSAPSVRVLDSARARARVRARSVPGGPHADVIVSLRPQLHPKKVSGDELQANATRLKKYVRDIADAIFESSVIAPLSVRQLSQSVLRISTQIQASKTVKRDPKAVGAWRTRAESENGEGRGPGTLTAAL